jgi:hypothetical protein
MISPDLHRTRFLNSEGDPEQPHIADCGPAAFESRPAPRAHLFTAKRHPEFVHPSPPSITSSSACGGMRNGMLGA